MTDQLYISQRRAKFLLKVTGKTLKEIEAAVTAMPTKRFGERDKVHMRHVEQIIAEHQRPPMERKSRTIKGLSAQHRETFRRTAQVEQAINAVREHARVSTMR